MGGECRAIEPVVTGEAVGVERPVLLVEVDHAQVPALDQQACEPGQHRVEVGDVVQRHHCDHEVEVLARDRPGGQVQVPDARVADHPGVDLGAHDVTHPARGVGHGDGADGVAQGLADKAGPGAVLQHADRTLERDGCPDGTCDDLGTLDLGGIGVSSRAVLISGSRSASAM